MSIARHKFGYLPGDLPEHEQIERMIRVDHAGEYGAKRIYQGQLAVLPADSAEAAQIRVMAAQEAEHLTTFEDLLVTRRVRPTLLYPLWHVAGYAMGAATALLGPRAAMACTIAVEQVIDQHYADQSENLPGSEPELKRTLDRFRADENEHEATARAAGGAEIVGYRVLAAAVKGASRLAIYLSQRL